jgi:endonuclease-3
MKQSGGEFRGPLGESLKEIRSRALRILRALEKAYPDAHVPLAHETPLELLVATILSAQVTDAKVNEVTRALFGKYRTAADWAAVPARRLESEIRSTGFFRSKARAIHESAEDIAKHHGGRVPDTMEGLTALRGVGRKTAGVLLAHAFGKPAIIVDTHFTRLSRRMGLTAEFDPTKIEFDVARILPERSWSSFSLMMTWHGRKTCVARKPRCGECPVAKLCPSAASLGEITWRVRAPGGRKRKRPRGGR